MKNNPILAIVTAIVVSFVPGLVQPASAASTLAIVPSGENAFLLKGIAIENVNAMDITVFYDTSLLASPRVTKGKMIEGSMMAVNDMTPGVVRLGVVRTAPVRGDGNIAALTFQQNGSSAGTILGVKASFMSSDGRQLPVAVQMIMNQPNTAAGDSNASPQSGQPANSAGPSVTVSALQAVPVVLTAPIVGPVSRDGKEQAEAATAGTGPGNDPSAGPQLPEPSRDPRDITVALESRPEKIQMTESVLEKFREYKGKRTKTALIGLFQQDETAAIRQSPSVALSDGKTPVRVFFVTSPGSTSPADVAIMGGRFISIKKDPDRTNTWIVELVPGKDVYEASVAVSQGEMKRIYPLAIAPKIQARLSKTDVIGDKDLDNYFQGGRPDVNNDKKSDYLDDYIITANYLAGGGTMWAGR